MRSESLQQISTQEVAYIFASKMREARSNKKANKQSSGSPKRYEEIRQRLTEKDLAYLTSKKDNFSIADRAILLFQAKSKYLSGLTEEERIQMHKDAGYTEDEINKITGKKIALAAGISVGLQLISFAGRSLSTVEEKFVPFIESIPASWTVPAVIGSLATYTASYIWITEENLRLTKKHGISANPGVTGLYFLSDKLFPNKTRDWIAKGTPIAQETFTYNILYPLGVLGASGETNKIIAGSLVAAGMNIIFTAGCKVWDRTHSPRHSRGRGNPEVK